MKAAEIGAEEKLRALQEVLQSVTFRRCEQLRNFLSFVVAEEVAGRGPVIREWDIARVLGRPANYSPDTDSTVRTRAHALRQKLEQYYREEAPGADVQIDVPKGGYVPRFRRISEDPPASVPDIEALESLETLFHPRVPPPAPAVTRKLVLAFVAGCGLCFTAVAALWGVGWIGVTPAASRPAEVAEVWAPILGSPDPVRVCVASPPQLWVRDYEDKPLPEKDPAFLVPMPDDPRLFDWYRQLSPTGPRSRLFLHTNSAGTLWGDAAGVQVVTRFLTENGVANELIPDRSLKADYVLRNVNLVAFGRPEYSALIASKLPANGFTVTYLPDVRRHGIALAAHPDREPRFVVLAGDGVNYGLITIRRETADDGRVYQTILFSGVISNGAQAAVEYLTTPRHLTRLTGLLRESGLHRWPKVLQVVVRSETSSYYPLKTEYQAHLVVQP